VYIHAHEEAPLPLPEPPTDWKPTAYSAVEVKDGLTKFFKQGWAGSANSNANSNLTGMSRAQQMPNNQQNITYKPINNQI
jgi:hypothetical protein